MQAGVLKGLLANVPDDVDLNMDLGDFEADVGSITYDEEYNLLTLRCVMEGEDEAGAGDDGELDECGEPLLEGQSCSLPEPSNGFLESI
jgi:hypothetical protein